MNSESNQSVSRSINPEISIMPVNDEDDPSRVCLSHNLQSSLSCRCGPDSNKAFAPVLFLINNLQQGFKPIESIGII